MQQTILALDFIRKVLNVERWLLTATKMFVRFKILMHATHSRHFTNLATSVYRARLALIVDINSYYVDDLQHTQKPTMFIHRIDRVGTGFVHAN